MENSVYVLGVRCQLAIATKQMSLESSELQLGVNNRHLFSCPLLPTCSPKAPEHVCSSIFTLHVTARSPLAILTTLRWISQAASLLGVSGHKACLLHPPPIHLSLFGPLMTREWSEQFHSLPWPKQPKRFCPVLLSGVCFMKAINCFHFPYIKLYESWTTQA